MSRTIGRVLLDGTRKIHALLEDTGTDVQCVSRDTSVEDRTGALIEEKKWFDNKCVLEFCSRVSKSEC